MDRDLIIVRGGGDIATGIIQKLHRAHFRVLALEVAAPMAIRRTVSLCEAVRLGECAVEDVRCRRADNQGAIFAAWADGAVPLAVDPDGAWIERLRPDGVVDAILAKRNLGTRMDMAPAVVGVGPGFEAGRDVHIAIETLRGHDLGRLIFSGCTAPNTGVPGELGGRSAERVIHAPASGQVRHVRRIGDVVDSGEVLFHVGETAVRAPFTGLLRGLIAEGLVVHQGMKIADIDPRTDVNCLTISDKARAIGGAALEAYLYLRKTP